MADGKHQTDGATAVPSQKLFVTENLNILMTMGYGLLRIHLGSRGANKMPKVQYKGSGSLN